MGLFYYIGNFVPYVIKSPLGDHTAAERKMLPATARRRRRMHFLIDRLVIISYTDVMS